MKVLVVGYGFAGKLHASAWKRIGYDVIYYNSPFYPPFEEVIEREKPDIVDFCDTPKSRIEYLVKYYNFLQDKTIYLEKPPCKPQDLEVYRYLCKSMDITPIHNYLYMVNEKPKEVVILRNGPHKSWYIDPDLSGGGIMLDHGYHWLYVADHYGVDLKELRGWVDGYPDEVCVVFGDEFKFFATWKSPIRLTVINGFITEFRTEKRMVESLVKIFKLSDNEKAELRLQSLRVMEFIKEVYENVGFCVRSEA